ncbi:hypothetical protein C8R43DRAFT_264579 [Mycena crocata]|nr:hypothetical protein C8R43DRAFT_264579 [Mycena crocata]
MSHALQIPEIVDTIFNFISRRADEDFLLNFPRILAILARTCRSFREPALNRIWRIQNTLHNLIRCLPRQLWQQTADMDIRLLGTLTPADVERFSFYSRRVQHLSFHKMGTHMFELLATLALHVPEQIMFPNLRNLTWDVGNEAFFPAIRLFLNPNLTYLAFPLHTTPCNLSLFPMLARECSSLTGASVMTRRFYPTGIDVSFDLQVTALSTFTRRLTRLETVTLQYIDGSALKHLSRLPSLRQMSLNIPLTLDLASLASLATHGPDDPNFPSLRVLELDSTSLELATSYMPAFSRCRLETLRIGIHTLAGHLIAAALYTAISLHIPHDALQMLDVGDTPDNISVRYPTPAVANVPLYLVSGVHLHPLLVFSNLTDITLRSPVGFAIDDRTAALMAAAWPCLTSLDISTVTSITHPPTMTLHGVSAFAQHCPHLRTLKIAFDATLVPEVGPSLGQRVLQSSLDTLYPGASPVTNPLSVARFLSGIFAGPVYIDTSLMGDNGDYLEDVNMDAQTQQRVQLWYETGEALTYFETARGEERQWAQRTGG